MPKRKGLGRGLDALLSGSAAASAMDGAGEGDLRQLPVDLVERRAKRAVFLEQVLLEAGAPPTVRVLRQSVEDLPDQAYDGVLARAFAPPADVLAHARRLLRPGGQVVLFLQADTPLPEHPGFEVFHVEHYRVGNKDRRSVTLRRA